LERRESVEKSLAAVRANKVAAINALKQNFQIYEKVPRSSQLDAEILSAFLTSAKEAGQFTELKDEQLEGLRWEMATGRLSGLPILSRLHALHPSEKVNNILIGAVAAQVQGDQWNGLDRVRAMEALLHMAKKGDKAATAAIIARLQDEHEDGYVHEAALRLLPQMAEKGDKAAVAAITHILQRHTYHPPTVRKEAVRSLFLLEMLLEESS